MIYTVTLNPSIDYVVRLEQLEVGHVNRMDADEKFPGGKGINVSRVLARLSAPAVALGFVGGFTGTFIRSRLATENIKANFTEIVADTRINVKIKSEQETEINSAGPVISEQELSVFKQTLQTVKKGDIVVFSGSIPRSVDHDIYQRLIVLVREQGAEVVCDFEGESLLDALQFKPLLIKPNKIELATMYDVELQDLDDIMKYGEQLRTAGGQNVIVSMAGDGAVLLSGEGNYFAAPISGVVKNSVGAGDSMVAGFLASFSQSRSVIEAFKCGVASGSATAFSDDLATGDYIQQLLAEVKIEKL